MTNKMRIPQNYDQKNLSPSEGYIVLKGESHIHTHLKQ